VGTGSGVDRAHGGAGGKAWGTVENAGQLQPSAIKGQEAEPAREGQAPRSAPGQLGPRRRWTAIGRDPRRGHQRQAGAVRALPGGTGLGGPGPSRALRQDRRECQKPGALRRELECLVAEASVQHCGPDLKHAMSAARRPAHLPSLVHAYVDQVVDRALSP